MVSEGDKVFPGFVEELLAKHCDRLVARVVAIGVLGFGDQFAVGDAFDVEKKVFKFWGLCGHVSRLAVVRIQHNVLPGGQGFRTQRTKKTQRENVESCGWGDVGKRGGGA